MEKKYSCGLDTSTANSLLEDIERDEFAYRNTKMAFLKIFACIVIAINLLATTPNVSAQSGTAWNYWTMKAWGANLGNWLVLEK